MTRVLHFGTISGRSKVDASDRAEYVHNRLQALLLDRPRPEGTNIWVHESFTDYGEPLKDNDDAVHIVVDVDTDAPLTPERAREIRDYLAETFMLVDYWIDSETTWGADERIHGLWGLESVSGRPTGGRR